MRILVPVLILTCLAIGCREPPTNTSTVQQDSVRHEPNISTETSSGFEIRVDQKEDIDEAGCNYKDGIHSATVDYYNPKTRHTATYKLKVHVHDCKVVRINFPNGGWLDEDHIPATSLNNYGLAVLKDDKERTWQVHLIR
jgi:hypothetical protein